MISARACRVYQVVTFATDVRHGNPAFVLRGVGGASDRALAAACALLHGDVMAVIDDAATEPGLRFFTPHGPHAGAGHATLAAAHVALRSGASPDSCEPPRSVTFRMADGGTKRADRVDGRIAIAFPAMPADRVDRATELAAALGASPVETWLSAFGYVAVFRDAATVGALRPDMARVGGFDRNAVIATAPAESGADIVVRVFAPKVGLPEDPVCGTAHRVIVPYWAERMGRTCLHSRHLSASGGDLWCETMGGDVIIAGESRLALEGMLELADDDQS